VSGELVGKGGRQVYCEIKVRKREGVGVGVSCMGVGRSCEYK